jgi:4-aminobutyrate aminotransferase / (S)-3-amino-2-methylpropionate transaminase / 5-aminovalerate transaminase
VDLVAGFGALVLGHAPHAASLAAAAQAERLTLALGDVYASEAKITLSEEIVAVYLAELRGAGHDVEGARVMLGTSGADAVTAALKTALLATGRPRVVAFEGAYHGLSHGPLAACGFSPSFREPFAAHLGVPVAFAPYPDAFGDVRLADEALTVVRRELAEGDVGAVLVEPILGRGGCVVPPAGFLRALAAAAREGGALLVADEVWTGWGRAGAMLSSADAAPDLVCLGKALGAGQAVSACVGRDDVMAAWGRHGGATLHTGTHFASPPACAAALACLSAMRDGDLVARGRALGERFREAIRAACPSLAVTGQGMLVGVRLADRAAALKVSRSLLERGFITLTGGVDGRALTLSPALDIDEPTLMAFVPALRASLDAPEDSA